MPCHSGPPLTTESEETQEGCKRERAEQAEQIQGKRGLLLVFTSNFRTPQLPGGLCQRKPSHSQQAADSPAWVQLPLLPAHFLATPTALSKKSWPMVNHLSPRCVR